ncbi:hypothetical protein GCM10023185_13030 [Hymenobacter saemangeumensis]|uniref:Uncharacterized protein n=1 Tax=Hymenobacter saemangeumensis TaxID=1084522 RepID=A0ABP8I7D7_9BACT
MPGMLAGAAATGVEGGAGAVAVVGAELVAQPLNSPAKAPAASNKYLRLVIEDGNGGKKRVAGILTPWISE